MGVSGSLPDLPDSTQVHTMSGWGLRSLSTSLLAWDSSTVQSGWYSPCVYIKIIVSLGCPSARGLCRPSNLARPGVRAPHPGWQDQTFKTTI